MNTNTRFEIISEAFRLMTGHLAIGKDQSPAAGTDEDERRQTWDDWITVHGAVIAAIFKAYDTVVGEDFDSK